MKRVADGLKEEIAEVERLLTARGRSGSRVLDSAFEELQTAGGKRIRPIFVLLGGKFGTGRPAAVLSMAASLEMIHMASLVHDDVIDSARTRRGRPTVKARYGNRIAMYGGDFMLAQALQALTELEEQAAHEVLAKAMVEICLGEIGQVEEKYDLDQSLRTYLRRIRRKTAILISSSCELGAIASGAPARSQRALRRYGYAVGMSFQIIDDILDITSTDEELGKPAGSDVLQGNLTLPVLLAKAEPGVRPLVELAAAGRMAEEDRERLLAVLRASGSIETAYAVSGRYLQKALAELVHLPDGEWKSALRDIALYLGKRKF